jgi:hypothetical protein
MAFLEEQAVWEDEIFRVETNTPWVGGNEGTANVQARKLANRSRWLKQYADEVVAARGEFESLSARLALYDDFNPENITALAELLNAVKETAENAVEEGNKTVTRRLQSGIALITNRGVIAGCTVSKSANAIRNLSLSAGSLFMGGIALFCPAMTNSAIVASNTTDVAQVCYGYLFTDGNAVRFSVTEFGAAVPENGLPICRITVPAGNDQVVDPNLASVIITDVRRIETGYPVQINSAANVSVALPNPMGDSEYAVYIDVLDFKGGFDQADTVRAGDKAANGFKLYVDGSIDTVKVRWTAVKLDIEEE